MASAHSVFRHAPAFVREALPHFNLVHYRLFSAIESVAGNFLGPVAAHHAAAVGSSLAMAAALLLPFFLLALALVDLWALRRGRLPVTAPPPTLPKPEAAKNASAAAPAAAPPVGAPPPEEALRWTVGEVCSFVREIGLAQHEPVASAFQRHGVSGALLLSLTRAELGELLGDATAIADRRQLAAKIADLRWASSRRAAVLRALRRLWPGWLFARFWPWRAKPKRE